MHYISAAGLATDASAGYPATGRVGAAASTPVSIARRAGSVMPRLLLSLILAFVALPAGTSPLVAPQKNWRQLATPNFRVIGNAGERDLRRVAGRLEQFREAIGILFPKAVVVASVPTTVIVFRSQKDYDPFKPLYKGKPKEIDGYFLPGPTANYVTMTAAGEERFGVIYHEYVHLLVNHTLQEAPLWFNEGLADYYSTFQVTGGGKQAALGRLHSEHVLLLRQQWLPLPALVGIGHDSPYYNEAEKMSVFYAESWALVHYLLLGREGRYAKGIGAFLTELDKGASLDEACTRAFSIGAATLERELRRYVEGERFLQTVVTFSERIGAVEQVPVTPLDEAQAHAALGDLLFRMQRPADARAQTEAALALDAALSEAHATMGRLLLASDRRDEAAAHLQKAATSPGAPWGAHFEYASLLIEAREPGASGEQDAVIDRELRRTIELQPSFSDAYAQLGWLKSQSSNDLAEAASHVKKAITLSPGNERYWLLLAHIHAARSDYASARAIASRLSTAAADAGVRSQAASLLSAATALMQHERELPVERARSAPAGQSPTLVPLFRKLAEGEQRLSGRLTDIQCSQSGGIVLIVLGRDGTARFEAAGFEAIEFISYRPDLTGRIECGRQADPVVIVTYRPADEVRSARVVAIEFVPEGYQPK